MYLIFFCVYRVTAPALVTAAPEEGCAGTGVFTAAGTAVAVAAAA